MKRIYSTKYRRLMCQLRLLGEDLARRETDMIREAASHAREYADSKGKPSEMDHYLAYRVKTEKAKTVGHIYRDLVYAITEAGIEL